MIDTLAEKDIKIEEIQSLAGSERSSGYANIQASLDTLTSTNSRLFLAAARIGGGEAGLAERLEDH